MADGMPAVALCNFIQKLDYTSLKKECLGGSTSSSIPKIKNIFDDAISSMNTSDINRVQELSDKGE